MLSQNETTTVKFCTDFIPIVRQILFYCEIVLRETISFVNAMCIFPTVRLNPVGKMTEQELPVSTTRHLSFTEWAWV